MSVVCAARAVLLPMPVSNSSTAVAPNGQRASVSLYVLHSLLALQLPLTMSPSCIWVVTLHRITPYSVSFRYAQIACIQSLPSCTMMSGDSAGRGKTHASSRLWQDHQHSQHGVSAGTSPPETDCIQRLKGGCCQDHTDTWHRMGRQGLECQLHFSRDCQHSPHSGTAALDTWI